jgi:hypothetical protein
MRLPRILFFTAALLAAASPALADATAFVGNTATPTNRRVKGFAFGMSLLVIGFEFEYANTAEDLTQGAPSLTTGMGNVLLQTPGAIFGIQPYLTTGGGIYRETLANDHETQFGLNTGGGVKVTLIGPLRARVDYRVFTLRGSPRYTPVHRVYAGVNLSF